MHVNFLHPVFETKVNCDVVSSDGYSVSNLVSSEFLEQSRGFLAAHFIKPPALVLFQLPFPIHVESIVIKPKVGSQISTGIAILVAEITSKAFSQGRKVRTITKKPQLRSIKLAKKQRTTGMDAKELMSEEKETSHNLSGGINSLITHSYDHDITPATVKGEHSKFFNQVAWLNNQEGQTVYFKNRQFEERRPVQSVCIPGSDRSDILQAEFQRLHCLQSVTHVALKITRRIGSSVPAIGRVQIWGQPALTCIPEVLKYAIDIQVKITETHQTHKGIQCHPNTSNRNGLYVEHDTPIKDNSAISIPEDFIDPITCEIMTIPLLLPSGQNVDTSTLEKHINAERLWGRPPSDPFTGKAFSAVYKAVPNSALKVRIDKFLLISGTNVTAFGRTVGKVNTFQSGVYERQAVSAQIDVMTKSGKVFHVSNKTREPATTKQIYNQRCQERLSGPRDNMSEETEAELGHEEAVSKSLDSALHQTFQGLHRFTRNETDDQNKATVTQSSIIPISTSSGKSRKRQASNLSEVVKNSLKKRSSIQCISCQRDLSTECIFHLPCRHVICRRCLTDSTQPTKDGRSCKLCGVPCSQKDVVRVHSI